jgi:hypothetical protein
LPGNLSPPPFFIHLPEVNVVLVLAGIVEEVLVYVERTLDHFLDRLVFPLRAFGQIIAGGHVSLVVLSWWNSSVSRDICGTSAS